MADMYGIRTRLRMNYECYTCGAGRGESCRTLRLADKPANSPHQSRWDQYHADQRTSDLIDSQRRVTRNRQPFVTTEADIAEALRPEGWGDGFSESLAKRVVGRLRGF